MGEAGPVKLFMAFYLTIEKPDLPSNGISMNMSILNPNRVIKSMLIQVHVNL